jgi:hypothetical protein
MATDNDADVAVGTEAFFDRPGHDGTAPGRPEPLVSFDAGDRDDDARHVDDVAGGEFVDDRIRLRE